MISFYGVFSFLKKQPEIFPFYDEDQLVRDRFIRHFFVAAHDEAKIAIGLQTL